ncbi:TPA: integrase [Enterobacter kobei]|nr:integrase [Enterobacter kobei]QFH90413.1 integrase [Enterobacter kobei]HAS1546880.1 integrase [Enterobacter kobei]
MLAFVAAIRTIHGTLSQAGFHCRREPVFYYPSDGHTNAQRVFEIMLSRWCPFEV